MKIESYAATSVIQYSFQVLYICHLGHLYEPKSLFIFSFTYRGLIEKMKLVNWSNNYSLPPKMIGHVFDFGEMKAC